MSLHLHTFTSVFSTSLLYVGLPRKAFPGKQAKVDTGLTGHQCFSVVAQATRQDSRKASPMAIFKWKNLIGQLNPLLDECWMKVGERWVCWVQHANMWQHCSLTAVQRKTAVVEESWWPEFNLFGSIPWCSFPWRKILPRLTQTNCYTVYSLNLIHMFTFTYIYIRVFNQPALCRFA